MGHFCYGKWLWDIVVMGHCFYGIFLLWDIVVMGYFVMGYCCYGLLLLWGIVVILF